MTGSRIDLRRGRGHREKGRHRGRDGRRKEMKNREEAREQYPS